MNIIHDTDTIRAALKALDTCGPSKTLFVTDRHGVVTGTLTDGDIRRGLLAGAMLDDTVGAVCHTQFTALRPGDDTIALTARCRALGIRQLPVLAPDGTLADVYDLDALDTIVPLRALLMAGGRGERLRPLTDVTPKPLLPVGGVPVIDTNIALLRRAGIRDITVSVRYKADMIRRHLGGTVSYITEEKPLGTIGALAAMPRDSRDIIVMNADLLTTFSIEKMYLAHRDTDADITVAAIPYTVSIPYAILDTDGTRVTGLREKPVSTYSANAGIYIIAPRIADTLSADTPLDAPDLITRVIATGGRVTLHPHDGTWLDIGTPADYARANTTP